jgi:hypothetical protein
MVATAELMGRRVYYCEVCSLAYENPALARKCEDYCRTHPSCSLEIGRQAVGSVEKPEIKAP